MVTKLLIAAVLILLGLTELGVSIPLGLMGVLTVVAGICLTIKTLLKARNNKR